MAFVKVGGQSRLYVDGKLVSSGSGGLGSADTSPGLTLGGAGPVVLDEVRISATSRYTGPKGEVLEFTPQSRFEPDADTLALYHFDEGQGDKLIDSSGNNHHGKIVGAKWVSVGGGSPVAPVWRPTAQQQAFLEAVAKLSVEEQVEAVKKKLSEVNPSFAPAKSTTKIDVGKVVSATFDLGEVGTEVWPLRAWPNLESCQLGGRQLKDLSPLAGLKWKELKLNSTVVVDLTPISGMPLSTLLLIFNSKLSDLSPLAGMPLTTLSLWNCSEVFDLKPLAGMPLVLLDCRGTKVFDLSPLAKLPLTNLECFGCRVSDLSPLKGMSLTSLGLGGTDVRDLSPLAGMPLTKLELAKTRVADLKPLSGMPLQWLGLSESAVSDLTLLTGMPLTDLNCNDTVVTDLVPVAGAPLKSLSFSRTSVSSLAPLSGLSLSSMDLDVPLFHEPDEKVVRSLAATTIITQGIQQGKFWEVYTARKQSADEFATATAKLPPDEQVTAIARRFQELKQTGVGFKPTVADGAIVEVTLTINDKVVDITPLRALTGLKRLTINGGPHWLDLSPLNSTPLESLTCRELIARRNAHILKSMTKLTKIDARPEPTAATSTANPDRRAAEYVLSIGGTISIKENGQERPIAAVGELPRDAFELTVVSLSGPLVNDAGMTHFKDCKNLTSLNLYLTQVSDTGLANFQGCKNLTSLYLNFVSDAGLAHFKDYRTSRSLS